MGLNARFVTSFLFCCAAVPSAGNDSLVRFFFEGKPDLALRYRYEFVDDATPGLKHARASTLRSALGYTTGNIGSLSAYLQIEDVRSIGSDTYNDGGSNGRIGYATVVDPEGTEVNQAYLRWGGIPRTVLTYGRQEVTHRDAPLHRFLGNIGFRQNQQTYDAFRAVTLAVPNAIVDYAYLWNANRIFGEDNPNRELRDSRMHSHAVNIQYSGFTVAKLEAYGYWLDFSGATSRRFSTSTFGARLQGNQQATGKLKLLYVVEAATQSDFADNPFNIDARYGLAEAGLRYVTGLPLDPIQLTLGYEYLSGKGGANAFQTPLGTNHAFQGAADRFLTTPGDGVRDAYLRVTSKVRDLQLGVEYHDFRADHSGYAYGKEWNFLAEKPLGKRFLLGAQYADYQADENARNTASQGQDLSKFWLYLQFRY